MRSNLQTIKSTLLNGVHFWLEGLSAIFSFLDGSHGKESACNAGDLGSMPGLGRSLGEGNDYPIQYSFFFFFQSSILAWRIPLTEEPGRLQSVGAQRVGHD